MPKIIGGRVEFEPRIQTLNHYLMLSQWVLFIWKTENWWALGHSHFTGVLFDLEVECIFQSVWNHISQSICFCVGWPWHSPSSNGVHFPVSMRQGGHYNCTDKQNRMKVKDSSMVFILPGSFYFLPLRSCHVQLFLSRSSTWTGSAGWDTIEREKEENARTPRSIEIRC